MLLSIFLLTTKRPINPKQTRVNGNLLGLVML